MHPIRKLRESGHATPELFAAPLPLSRSADFFATNSALQWATACRPREAEFNAASDANVIGNRCTVRRVARVN
jgi:hypothetical protein